VRFELTVLEFCRLLRWASPPPLHELFGVPGRIRTLTSSFGDCRAAIDTTDTLFGTPTWTRTRIIPSSRGIAEV
jgi:hypothetical protein